MIVYIAGPMTGLPDYNYPAFHAAEEALKAAGHHVINPARGGGEPHWTWVDWMRRSLQDLSHAEAIHLLHGWEQSRGAVLEAHIATTLELPRIGSEVDA